MLLTRRRPADSERLPDTRDGGDNGFPPPTAQQQMAAVAAERAARGPRYSFQDDEDEFPVPGGARDTKHSFAETRSMSGSDAGAASLASLSPPLHVADLCNDSVSSMHSARSTRPPSQHRSARQAQQQQQHATSGVIPVGISELPERTSRDVSAALDLPMPPPVGGVQYANRNSDVLELSSMECKTPMVQVAIPLMLATAMPVELDGTAISRPDRSRDASRQPSRQASRQASRERKSVRQSSSAEKAAQSARQSMHQQPSPPPAEEQPEPPRARKSVVQSARQSVAQSARQSMQPPAPPSARQSMQPPPAQSARQSMQPPAPPSARQSMQPPAPPPARQSVQQSARQSVAQSARQSARQSMQAETEE
jgi:hypothetical protein